MAAKQKRAQRIYLKDYKAADFRIPAIALEFDLEREKTRVRSRLTVKRSGDHDRPLVLHGEKLDLISLSLIHI